MFGLATFERRPCGLGLSHSYKYGVANKLDVKFGKLDYAVAT